MTKFKFDERECPTPGCGGIARADFVDIGVGNQQCGPFGCEKCGWVESVEHIELTLIVNHPAPCPLHEIAEGDCAYDLTLCTCGDDL